MFQPRVQFILFLLAGSVSLAAANRQTLQVAGLSQPVEIFKDPWGISHIYAQSESDLFFAQGYNAARDRLFQLEMWRRRATGTLAELLGADYVNADIGSRLFRYRGDLQQELNHYHPRGETIIVSFVAGINAYIDETRRRPELLPVEFEVLDFKPQHWTPEAVISRHQGLLGNVAQELNYGRAVARLGADRILQLSNFHPGTPDVSLDPALDADLLFDDILALYDAFRQSVQPGPSSFGESGAEPQEAEQVDGDAAGSNNWVISGALTQSGYPIMANDPHRDQSVPSLRYWVHLNAPGWNVIGGGEPAVPGVSIGHNGVGAWGLTVFRTDGEDLYVYDLNPSGSAQYRYQDRWEQMQTVAETIAVKDQPPVKVTLKYTRHGPVVYEDLKHLKAYAVRAAWLEPGGAPYLASLRIDQAHNWEEFREACSYFHIPGENMVWADRQGNIGWQAVGVAPIRPNWSGLVPVPGDGGYEWDGYLPIRSKPHIYNPQKGFWATANANLLPSDYPHRSAVGWEWSDSFRQNRIIEFLSSGRKHTLMDMLQLQTDFVSIPARTLVPLLEHLMAGDKITEKARQMLLNWDFRLNSNSIEAGIYVAWERHLEDSAERRFVDEKLRGFLPRLSLNKLINWILVPDSRFGVDPVAGRDRFLLEVLQQATRWLTQQLGSDPSHWQLGQYKQAQIRHPLSALVNASLRDRLDVGPLPRGGNSYTVGNTGRGNNQTGGASFRIIVDTSDWDLTLGMNSPGQSGDPDSPFYQNLFKLWAQDRAFPVFYSQAKVEAAAVEILELQPGG